jgi:hypothetical protein
MRLPRTLLDRRKCIARNAGGIRQIDTIDAKQRSRRSDLTSWNHEYYSSRHELLCI